MPVLAGHISDEASGATVAVRAPSHAGGSGPMWVDHRLRRDQGMPFLQTVRLPARWPTRRQASHRRPHLSPNRVAVSRFTFEMGDPKHLGHVLRAVRAIDGVYDVYRMTS